MNEEQGKHLALEEIKRIMKRLAGEGLTPEEIMEQWIQEQVLEQRDEELFERMKGLSKDRQRDIQAAQKRMPWEMCEWR